MSDIGKQLRIFGLMVAAFAGLYFMPVGWARFDNGVFEALNLAKWYAREHVLLCLVPAFFIAGAISVFVSQASVMKYLGARANKVLAYSVASVAGSVLAVCSCTVLPLFAGIWRMGAGLGPATAFLYSGPAINVLAIILTARILGPELGIARAVGAVTFSIVIGLAMHLIFRKEEVAKAEAQMAMPEAEVSRPLWKNAAFFAAMVGVLVFANWARSGDARAAFLCCPGGLATYHIEGSIVSRDASGVTICDASGQNNFIPANRLTELRENADGSLYSQVYWSRWFIVACLGLVLAWMIIRWFRRDELKDWTSTTWGFAKQILPLLLGGVLVAGFLLGRPGHEAMIPSQYVEAMVGQSPDVFLKLTGWSGGAMDGFTRAVWPVWTNFFAAIFGAFMYFATLTEVPILQGLLGAGMGKGPALALLLAGPALSLPSMLVIAGIMGWRKTIVYVSLVVVMATLSGMLFGAIVS